MGFTKKQVRGLLTALGAQVRLENDVAKRKHKYGAVRTTVDGIEFASKREAKRYGELKVFEKEGLIKDLSLQPSFSLVVNGDDVGTYRADFEYWELIGATYFHVIEDCKGYKTDVYRLKKKLMKAIHGIVIRES